MNKKEKTIIFDFDGVIADSFDIALEVNQMSKPTLTRERYEKVWNGNIADVVYEDEVVKEVDFFTEYGKRFESLGIDNNIKDIIKSLKKDFKLFIVSSTNSSIIKKYLTRHDILDCFAEVLGYDIETSKVKKFNMVFEKYKILPSETIFISDTAGDIKEAQEAKINFIIGILGGYQKKESIAKAKPDIIVKDFNEFFKVVKKRITRNA